MSVTPVSPDIAELRRRLSELLPRDERRLQRRIEGTRRIRDEVARAAVLTEIAAEVSQAEQRRAARLAAVPPLTYPAELPVSQRRDDILAAIRDHQVVVVAGETGSGKTTQLPKICLELGRGVRGQIGHTQPRRIAAAHGVDPARVVLRWHVQHGIVVIPKSVTPERINRNAQLDGFVLGEQEMAQIDGLSRV